MADNHWQYLIQFLNLDINGLKTDPPLFDSVQQEANQKREFLQPNNHLVDAHFNERVHALFKYLFWAKGLKIE